MTWSLKVPLKGFKGLRFKGLRAEGITGSRAYGLGLRAS